jgi:hypothetical protein
MGFKIQLKAYNDTVSTPHVVYEAGNLTNFDYSTSIPVVTFGLPEFYLEGAILTKAEGNTGKVVFSWVIKDETSNPFTVMNTWDIILPDGVGAEEFYPDSVAWSGTNSLANAIYTSRRLFTTATDSTTYETYDVKTADGQMIALSEYFEKKGFTSTERHRFILLDETLNVDGSVASSKFIFNLEGLITRLSFQKSGTEPVTWNATIEFQAGDVVDSGE